MTIKDKVLAVLAAIGSVFSAIFYVLFKQAKEERKAAELKAENAAEAAQRVEEQIAIVTKEKKENETKLQEACNNTIDGANSAIELMQNLAEKGKQRNSSTNK